MAVKYAAKCTNVLSDKGPIGISYILGKWRLEAPRIYIDYDIKTRYKSYGAIISQNEAIRVILPSMTL